MYYGAQGDGTTDDSGAFQLAVNAANANGSGAGGIGGYVFIGAYSFKIGASLTVPANVAFLSVGAALSGVGAGTVTPIITLATTGVNSISGSASPQLIVTSTAGGEIERLAGNASGWYSLYDTNGTVRRGLIGFGGAGGLLSNALLNAVVLRSEAAIQLGVGPSVAMTIREVGYGPGTGYIGTGGLTTPNSQLNLGGEGSPELRMTSTIAGDWGWAANADGGLYCEDHVVSVDRMRLPARFSLAQAGIQQIENGSGLLIAISEDNPFVGIFILRKSLATVIVSDPSVAFSTVKGTASRTNVYWNAGSGHMELENQEGATRHYSYTWIGTNGA